MKLSFFGATQTVTGSRHLLTCGERRVLVDCGLFQRYKYLRLKNWNQPPFAAGAIDAVLLTHAHLDHSGYLPLLVRNGFKGRIYATPATTEPRSRSCRLHRPMPMQPSCSPGCARSRTPRGERSLRTASLRPAMRCASGSSRSLAGR